MKYLSLVFLLVACSFSSLNLEIKRGEEAENNQNYERAVEHYKRVIKREPKTDMALYASKKVANLSVIYLQNFEDAIFAYRNLIKFSPKEDDRKKALEQLAKLYYEKLNRYEEAITEFQRLLSIIDEDLKIIEIRFLIARSYFYMNRMFQANTELGEILKMKNSTNPEVKDFIFKALTLRASIYHSEKKYDEAIELFREIMRDYPEKALAEKIWLNLSICYEDTKQFSEAVSLLENIKAEQTEKTFIEQKIARLKERMQQEPGARGFRK